MISAVVFDFDGTLADSFPMIHRAYEHALRSLGQKITFSDIPRLCFNKTEESITKELGLPEKVDEFQHAYFSYLQSNTKEVVPLPGAESMLKHLQKLDVPMGLVTFSQRWYIEQVVPQLGWSDYFTSIISFNDVRKPKPDPEAIFLINKVLQIDPQCILVVGDAKNDILLGKNAQTQTALVAHPSLQTYHNSTDIARLTSPDHTINQLEQVVQIVRAATPTIL